MGIFVEEAPFHSPFRICEIGLLCCEMALVCQRGVSQLRNTLRNGAMVAKIGDFTLWGFRSYEMELLCCEMALVCQEGVSQRGVLGCEIISQRRAIFAANPRFRSGHLRAAKSFRSRWPFL